MPKRFPFFRSGMIYIPYGVVHLLGKITLNYWALGIDALSARDAVDMWLPGFGGLLRQRDVDEEPYIFSLIVVLTAPA